MLHNKAFCFYKPKVGKWDPITRVRWGPLWKHMLIHIHIELSTCNHTNQGRFLNQEGTGPEWWNRESQWIGKRKCWQNNKDFRKNFIERSRNSSKETNDGKNGISTSFQLFGKQRYSADTLTNKLQKTVSQQYCCGETVIIDEQWVISKELNKGLSQTNSTWQDLSTFTCAKTSYKHNKESAIKWVTKTCVW